jgi:hypothetical protein
MNNKLSTKPIPKGFYCYTIINGKYINCPYWSIRNDKPSQENGYCSYLECGDWEDDHLSLLWDRCKECGINEYTDEELEQICN